MKLSPDLVGRADLIVSEGGKAKTGIDGNTASIGPLCSA